jgi:hypothetical protein
VSGSWLGLVPHSAVPKKGTFIMAFSLAPLLIHSHAVPLEAREALRLASSANPEGRRSALVNAARVLYTETALDCSDAMEVVGLRECSCD